MCFADLFGACPGAKGEGHLFQSLQWVAGRNISTVEAHKVVASSINLQKTLKN